MSGTGYGYGTDMLQPHSGLLMWELRLLAKLLLWLPRQNLGNWSLCCWSRLAFMMFCTCASDAAIVSGSMLWLLALVAAL
mmetsp:Transcript_123285/g.239819  ORF Transcript_123285/g.239819 Transcript_123285/m.239819 type:complete len:80 (-) Transcript_123285:111-350(-)